MARAFPLIHALVGTSPLRIIPRRIIIKFPFDIRLVIFQTHDVLLKFREIGGIKLVFHAGQLLGHGGVGHRQMHHGGIEVLEHSAYPDKGSDGEGLEDVKDKSPRMEPFIAIAA